MLEHRVTAAVQDSSDEFIVAAKFGFAIFDRKTGKIKYLKRTYDDKAEGGLLAGRMRCVLRGVQRLIC